MLLVFLVAILPSDVPSLDAEWRVTSGYPPVLTLGTDLQFSETILLQLRIEGRIHLHPPEPQWVELGARIAPGVRVELSKAVEWWTLVDLGYAAVFWDLAAAALSQPEWQHTLLVSPQIWLMAWPDAAQGRLRLGFGLATPLKARTLLGAWDTLFSIHGLGHLTWMITPAWGLLIEVAAGVHLTALGFNYNPAQPDLNVSMGAVFR